MVPSSKNVCNLYLKGALLPSQIPKHSMPLSSFFLLGIVLTNSIQRGSQKPIGKGKVSAIGLYLAIIPG